MFRKIGVGLFVSVIAVAATIPWAFPLLLEFETSYFPVVIAPAEIEQQTQVSDLRREVSGKSLKVRDCDYRGIEWNFGRRGFANSNIFQHFGEPPNPKPMGPFPFGPWVLHMSPEQNIKDTHANVRHQCYFMKEKFGRRFPHFWHSRSQFY